MSGWQVAVVVGAVALISSAEARAESDASAPYINTWLVAGTFDNARDNAGYEYDWVGEESVEPRLGAVSAGRPWRYFDDRLFSRNYDDYQDLFSYFRVKRGESIRARVAYAHVYMHSAAAQPAQLRVSADNALKAWVNGVQIAASTEGTPYRDMVIADVALDAGWNRLLLKVSNQDAGRFGFYARLAGADGKRLPGLTCSVEPGGGELAVATQTMEDADTGPLPVAYREWPYVGARASEQKPWAPGLRKPEIAMSASGFVLTAAGGAPPYRWSLAEGDLPEGLALREDGALAGTVAKTAELGEYGFSVKVTDAAGVESINSLAMTVKERPNKWVEEARLTALIHHPESMPVDGFDAFAQLMARQGYALGMVISYNNGKHKYRWPSIYEPDNPNGILIGRYKAALEAAGVKFGMYIGNLNGPNHGGDNGAILLVEDAIRRYQPAAFWFDWAGWDGVSLDALYSMIKSYDPDTVVFLNGIPTMSNGDWDIINLEGWGCWGDRHWDLMPFDFVWPKKNAVEAWRLVADPEFEYSEGVVSDWQAYLRLQVALIGEGRIANIDHSPTIASALNAEGRLDALEDSPLMQVHMKMAEWANPPGLPPLHESYTQVNPGPLPAAPWGYSTINLERDVIYLHMIETPYGKTGKPEGDTITISNLAQPVTDVRCMNTGKELAYGMDGDRKIYSLDIRLEGLEADPVDTIIRLELVAPYPDVEPPATEDTDPVPPGNLAWRRPAQLLSRDGSHSLVASAFHFAHYGVDGIPLTFACGGGEWAWTYHVDLEAVHKVNRIVINFGKGYPTEYKVHLSRDGEAWQTVHHGAGSPNDRYEHVFEPMGARYIRIEAVKPDGPNQEGVQMHIAELDVYEAESM
jgi:F5/8 type C domain/Putative Ig domain